MASRSREVRPSAHEPVGGRLEVGEHLRLVGAHAGLVPGLALLATAAQAGDRHLAAQLAPGGDERAPRRRLGDVEPAVAGEEGRRPLRRSSCPRRARASIGTRVPSVDG